MTFADYLELCRADGWDAKIPVAKRTASRFGAAAVWRSSARLSSAASRTPAQLSIAFHPSVLGAVALDYSPYRRRRRRALRGLVFCIG
jgi:hypothetical protein